MKKTFAAIIAIAVLAVVAVAQADQVKFLTRTGSGVVPSQDIHYTVMDLNGNKVAEETVTAPEGVTINNLPNGSYFVSAEQPSTGYFGSKSIEVTDDSEDELVLGPDGLKEYNPSEPQYAQPQAGEPAPGTTDPYSNIPTNQAPNAGIGRAGIVLGAGALAAAIVAIALATDDDSVSNNAD